MEDTSTARLARRVKENNERIEKNEEKIEENNERIEENVNGAISAADENIAVFDGTDGKKIKDGGKKISDFLALSGGTLTGDLNVGGNALRNYHEITSNNGNDYDAYPFGISYSMSFSANWTQTTGEDIPISGTIETIKIGHTRFIQELTAYDGRYKLFRTYHPDTPSGGFTEWEIIGGHDSGWINATMMNGWVDNLYVYNYDHVGYRRLGNKIYLRGNTRSGTIGTAAFVLPPGYRPLKNKIISTISTDAGNVQTAALLKIFADGSVKPEMGDNRFFVLDGVSFLLD